MLSTGTFLGLTILRIRHCTKTAIIFQVPMRLTIAHCFTVFLTKNTFLCQRLIFVSYYVHITSVTSEKQKILFFVFFFSRVSKPVILKLSLPSRRFDFSSVSK